MTSFGNTHDSKLCTPCLSVSAILLVVVKNLGVRIGWYSFVEFGVAVARNREAVSKVVRKDGFTTAERENMVENIYVQRTNAKTRQMRRTPWRWISNMREME